MQICISLKQPGLSLISTDVPDTRPETDYSVGSTPIRYMQLNPLVE